MNRVRADLGKVQTLLRRALSRSKDAGNNQLSIATAAGVASSEA